MFSLRRKKQHATPASPIPPMEFCSDIDGCLFAVVDAAEHDMSGWAIEATYTNGRVSVYPFDRGTAWRHAGGSELKLAYGGSEQVSAWLAVADRDSTDVYIAPDGSRYLPDGTPV